MRMSTNRKTSNLLIAFALLRPGPRTIRQRNTWLTQGQAQGYKADKKTISTKHLTKRADTKTRQPVSLSENTSQKEQADLTSNLPQKRVKQTVKLNRPEKPSQPNGFCSLGPKPTFRIVIIYIYIYIYMYEGAVGVVGLERGAAGDRRARHGALCIVCMCVYIYIYIYIYMFMYVYI